MSILSLVPKLFCSITLTWALWVYLREVCAVALHEWPVAAFVLGSVATALYAISMYTYYQIVAVGPGSPLDYDQLRIANLRLLEPTQTANPYETIAPEAREVPPTDYMTSNTLTSATGYRYCTKCSVWKPDRTHHCSSSGKCILKMDHYCPWFSTCIGFFNQKYFVQLLFYVCWYSTLMYVSALVVLWHFFTNQEYLNTTLSINLVLLFVLGISFSIALSFFSSFMVYLVLQNKTTIEFQDARTNYNGSFRYEFDADGKKKKIGHIFDLGYRRNWEAVMGPSWYTWLLPVSVTNRSIHAKLNNGINFEVNPEIYDKWKQSVDLQERMNHQLAEYKRRNRSHLNLNP